MNSLVNTTFAPVSLLVLIAAFLIGGNALWVGLAYIVLVATLLDAIWKMDDDGSALDEPDILIPTALLSIVAAAAFAFFIPETSTLELVVGTVMAGMIFGTVANIVAHELIHQEDRPVRFVIGMMLEALSLDPADTVGHDLHHNLVATPADPSSARRNEGFWHFMSRSVPGAALGAFDLESQRLKHVGKGAWSPYSRVLQATAIQFGVVALFWLVASWRGVLAFLAAGILARIIVEATKYSSHYGLVRVPGAPIEMRHSWNAKGGVSSRALFNAGWHSDHHVNGERPYREIELPDNAPINPYSAGLTFAMALVPPIWFARMNPLVENWVAEFASPDEAAIAAAR
ncbi:MAG: fatty acid desaturase [Rhizobiaceae bacterium]|nr:fatty acid desaturase [Rhizobiaceae bacterium]